MGLVRINIRPIAETVIRAMPTRGMSHSLRRALGAAAMQFWKKTAQSELRSTSRDYAAAIRYEEEGDRVLITLNGQMPNMIENGWEGGDLRQWLLKGRNAKLGANGMYNTVPFRHGMPGTGGRNVGIAMPEPIYEVAKKLSPTLTGIGKGGTQWGDRLRPNLPMKAEARRLLLTKSQPWHATSTFMGMIRQAKIFKSGRLQTTGYTTFRRISAFTRDAARHWIHPGIKARRFAPRVQAHVEAIAEQLVLGSLGK